MKKLGLNKGVAEYLAKDFAWRYKHIAATPTMVKKFSRPKPKKERK